MSNETLELFEMIISEDLKRLDELAYSSSDIEQRDRLIKEIERLSTKLTEAEGLVSKAYNDDRAREIEMDKHKNLIELDKKKARTETITKVVVGVAGVAVPAVVNLITLAAWENKLTELLKFEETGRITTSAGRTVLNFPRIW